MRITQTIATFPLIAALAVAGDWADFRGPMRNGTSPEKGLPSKWTPDGENFLWKAPYGGRSTPIVMDGRLYMLNPSGDGATLQERVLCLDAYTGKLIWEYKYNMFHSDVPKHRVAWSSPAGDPETGNIYVFGTGGTLLALTRDGKKIWEHAMNEEFGLVTTHGGRTVSPIIEGDLLIVSGVNTGWGPTSPPRHRFWAFDKRTGQIIYVSAPGGAPYDTTYSPPIVATINGTKLLIAGGGDGMVHAIVLNTGESYWKYELSKRGVNTGVVLYNNTAYVSQSEENIGINEMGMLAAIDATHRGDIGKDQIKWALPGFQGGYSSPTIDGDRVYQIDNGSNIFAFDAVTGKQIWKQNLGTIQKASPILADGKIYVGNENGRFYILHPTNEGCQILDQDELGGIQNGVEVTITASPAVSNGVVYVVTSNMIYALGRKNVTPTPKPPAVTVTPGAPAKILVTPAQLLLKPGDKVQFTARAYDANGNFVRNVAATWKTALGGTIAPNGEFTVDPANKGQIGAVQATFENLNASADVLVHPVLPIDVNFDTMQPGRPPANWVNAGIKYEVRALEGSNVLVKLADNPATTRARSFFGPNDAHDYTIEADVRAIDRRRQMGDPGVVAGRYQLTLAGNLQYLRIQPWQPETVQPYDPKLTRTRQVPFAWKGDTWYRMKLRVENMPGGRTRVQGKAWPKAEAEPAAWTIETIDDLGSRQGAPGIYADAQNEIFFDNIKVTSN